MLKLRHTTMIMISGLVWVGIGAMLLSIGLGLLLKSAQFEATLSGEFLPMMEAFIPFLADLEQAAIVIIALSLFVGFLKGRFVLSKSAFRTIAHIRSLPDPAPVSKMYGTSYYVLIGLMMGLGMTIKYLGIPNDIRGAVDVAVGSALLNGAMVYFRQASVRLEPIPAE